MDEIYMTQEGFDKIKAELERMKTVDRLEVQKMIGEAKSFGDLSENSEYDAAKTKEAQLETKIIELENQLKLAKIIDEKKLSTKEVSIGCTVKLFDVEFDEEVEYKITGENESDPASGKISNTSPVGAALLGAKVGDEVKVMTPGGECVYKVLKISI
ncbi:MAG: transcription elongation factor GreA [Clostridiales bacterium]|nr:transcription elongation factor GreA [Candidatus Apopatousia equi]